MSAEADWATEFSDNFYDIHILKDSVAFFLLQPTFKC